MSAIFIQTKFHRLWFTSWGCRTRKLHHDAHVDATPHPDQPHYSVIAHRCGYSDNLMQYCQEHELAHCVVAEFLRNGPSYTLTCLIENVQPRLFENTCEEMLAQALQRFARANQRPIIGDVDWDSMRIQFLNYIAKAKQLNHDLPQT